MCKRDSPLGVEIPRTGRSRLLGSSIGLFHVLTSYADRMRTLLWLAAAAVVVASVLAAQTAPGSPDRRSAACRPGQLVDEIRTQDVAAHLQFLSDDLLKGRAPSTRGGQLAAQLALIGDEPAGDNGLLSGRRDSNTPSIFRSSRLALRASRERASSVWK